MRAKSGALLVGGVVLVGGALASLVWNGKEESALALRCAWKEGQRAQYRIAATSRGEVYESLLSGGSGGAPKAMEASYEVDLDVEAVALKDGPGYRGVLRSTGDAEVGEAFVFRMDENCRFSSFGFVASDERASRDLKKSLMLLLEAVGGEGASWQTTQEDATGVYTASYRMDAGSGKVFRNKLYYSKVTPLGPEVALKAEIEATGSSFVPSSDFWLASADVTEGMRLATERGQTFTRVVASAKVRLRDGAPLAGAPATAAASTEVAWEGARRDDTAKLSAPTYGGIPDPSVRTLDDALSRFAEGAFENGQIDRKAVDDMVSFLLANPQEVQPLLDRVKNAQVAENLHDFLFFVLEKTGSPEVQRALAKVLEDAEHTKANRLRAMHALADVERPLPETLDALLTAAKPFGEDGESEHDLSSTALLALGVLERKQTEGPAKELGTRAGDALADKMRGAAGDEERSALAEALGNTGNPRHAPLIAEQLNHGNHLVRLGAARGLARIGVPEADQMLMEAVERERAADPRRSIAEAWAGKDGPAGAFDVGKLTAMLASEENADIRIALITVLGREAATQPAAKQALIAQYPKERSPKVKYKIGSYLKADELL